MNLLINKHLTSTIVLKTISLVFGYALWSIFSHSHLATRRFEIPLAFYGNNIQAVKAPEKIMVTLEAKRIDLQAIDTKCLAAHIDTSLLQPGSNLINVDNKTLFLPEAIKLVHYSPVNIIVHLQENQSKT